MTERSTCCGRADAERCRCYTDATAIAGAVRAFVRRRVRHPQDAEDITQDALLRLYRHAPSLHDEQALDAWMYRIARTAIVDHHRRTAARPEPTDADVDLPTEEPEDRDVERVLAACLVPLLERLPADYRHALELTDLGGLTQQRAAQELGLSVSGTKSRVQRGRRLLRAEIAHCCEIAVDRAGGLADARPRRPDGRC